MDETSAFVVFVFGSGDVDESDAVVFVVVGDERQILVRMHDSAAKEAAVKTLHVLEARRPEDYVGEFGRRDDLLLCAVGGHVGCWL